MWDGNSVMQVDISPNVLQPKLENGHQWYLLAGQPNPENIRNLRWSNTWQTPRFLEELLQIQVSDWGMGELSGIDVDELGHGCLRYTLLRQYLNIYKPRCQP
ncbi:TPA: hypothetical protein DEA21_03475 [Candidatus Uhrbacteria bacterium]|nr:hypothetical protein [Candidatus Uhrbacteria bacterium]